MDYENKYLRCALSHMNHKQMKYLYNEILHLNHSLLHFPSAFNSSTSFIVNSNPNGWLSEYALKVSPSEILCLLKTSLTFSASFTFTSKPSTWYFPSGLAECCVNPSEVKEHQNFTFKFELRVKCIFLLTIVSLSFKDSIEGFVY